MSNIAMNGNHLDESTTAQARSNSPSTTHNKTGDAHDQVQATGFWEWDARIRVNQSAVGGPFSIILFLGEIPQDPSSWSTNPNYVGSHSVYVTRCSNSDKREIQGSVPLNDGITRLSGLPSFQPNVVEPYLTENLHWYIIKTGQVIDISSVPSLEVTVIATRLILPPGAMFPEPSETHHYHGITFGRPGGSRQAPVS